MERISLEKMPPVKNENLVHLKRYVQFINSRPIRELHQKGFHTHHIYPRSIAIKNNVENFDEDWNLTELTAREHFIAHLILWKCGYPEMTYAFKFAIANTTKDFKITSRQYESINNVGSIWINKDGKSLQVKLEDAPDGWEIGMAGNRIWINNGIENKFILDTEPIPENFKPGRLSIGYWIHNDVEERYTNEDLIPDGYEIGRLLTTTKDTQWVTNGTINKMIKKNSPLPENFTVGMSRQLNKHTLITNGVENKYLYEGEDIPNGWRKGQIQNMKKKTWINDGSKNQRWDMENELPIGWKQGRIVGGFFITNGIEAKLVTNESDIPNGWRRGRLIRTKQQIIKETLTI